MSNSFSICPVCLDTWLDEQFNIDGNCPACADAALLTMLLDQHGVDLNWIVEHNLLSPRQAQLIDCNTLSLSLFRD